MKIAVLVRYEPVARRLLELRSSGTIVRISGREELLATFPDTNVLVVANGGLRFRYIDAECFAGVRDLRFIQTCGVSHDAIDMDAARAAGVRVATVPAQNSASVAEMAILLLLGAARRQKLWPRAIFRGELGALYGTELSGKGLCIVGFGRVGTIVCRVAKALGMEVLAVDRESEDELAAEFGARAASCRDLPRLLADVDFVMLSLPLDETTFHMFDWELFRAMKPGSSLINVSRAALVVRDDLRSALDTGSLSGYATDVWWDEPVDPTDPLLDRDNVLLSPHLGGATEEVLERTFAVIADNLSRFAAGISPLHLAV